MMSKTICYEEVCGVHDKINFFSLVIVTLAAATVILGVITLDAARVGFEFLSIPMIPTDFL